MSIEMSIKKSFKTIVEGKIRLCSGVDFGLPKRYHSLTFRGYV